MFEGLFQPTHLLLVLAIALVVFGPSRLPELGAGLGKAIRDFKKTMSEEETKVVDAEPVRRSVEEKP